jgi:hypothetical protein
MHYQIVNADARSVTLWDGVTKDPKHPREPYGIFTLAIGAHDFRVGESVDITIRSSRVIGPYTVVAREHPSSANPPFCEKHGVFHVLGLKCNTTK